RPVVIAKTTERGELHRTKPSVGSPASDGQASGRHALEGLDLSTIWACAAVMACRPRSTKPRWRSRFREMRGGRAGPKQDRRNPQLGQACAPVGAPGYAEYMTRVKYRWVPGMW